MLPEFVARLGCRPLGVTSASFLPVHEAVLYVVNLAGSFLTVKFLLRPDL